MLCKKEVEPCGSDIPVRQELGQTISKVIKPAVVIIVIALLTVLMVLLRRHRRTKAEQAKRDAVYAKVLERYQQDLRAGMVRAEVKTYLDAQNVPYGPIFWRGSGNAWSYAVRIGEDPGDGLVCGYWTVYVGLDFDAPVAETPETGDGLPTDRLTKIELHKIGHCV